MCLRENGKRYDIPRLCAKVVVRNSSPRKRAILASQSYDIGKSYALTVFSPLGTSYYITAILTKG